MPPRRLWRWLLALILTVSGAAVIAIVILDHQVHIDYVRPESPSELVVGVTAGPASWTRITSISETAEAVRIAVRTLARPGPTTALGTAVELPVRLTAPLGNREVIDASSDTAVPETRCQLPTVFGQGCVIAR
jgi:hypothetical protein